MSFALPALFGFRRLPRKLKKRHAEALAKTWRLAWWAQRTNVRWTSPPMTEHMARTAARSIRDSVEHVSLGITATAERIPAVEP